MHPKSTESRVSEWIQQHFSTSLLALNFHYSIPATVLYSPKLGKTPSTSKTVHYIYELHKTTRIKQAHATSKFGTSTCSNSEKTYLSSLTCYQLGIHVQVVCTSIYHLTLSSFSLFEPKAHNKVGMPTMILYLNGTHIFERHVIWCSPKNGQHKDVCLEKIGLHAQNIKTILVSTVNDSGDLYKHSMSMKPIHLKA